MRKLKSFTVIVRYHVQLSNGMWREVIVLKTVQATTRRDAELMAIRESLEKQTGLASHKHI